jgi:hypothetical protein
MTSISTFIHYVRRTKSKEEKFTARLLRHFIGEKEACADCCEGVYTGVIDYRPSEEKAMEYATYVKKKLMEFGLKVTVFEPTQDKDEAYMEPGCEYIRYVVYDGTSITD